MKGRKRTWRTKLNLSWAAGLLCGAVVLAVVAGAANAQPIPIRIGYTVPAFEIHTLFYMKPELLKHYGKSYTTELINFRGSTPQIQGFAAKAVEFGALAYSSFPLAVTNAGLDLKILADDLQDGTNGAFTEPWTVLESSPIKTVKDLKGKLLATNAHGTAVDLAMQVMLKKNNLVAGKDYTVVEVMFPNQEVMLRQGKIDLAIFVQPFWSNALKTGGLRTIFTMMDAMDGPTQIVAFNGRGDFLRNRPEVAKDFMEDFLRAWKWYLDPANRDEAVKVAAKFTKRPEAAFSSWFLLRQWDSYRDPNAWPNIDAFQRNVDTLHKYGLMEKQFKVSDYVDLSWLKEAHRRIGSK
ncbi:MAG: ABC transporter substrate-binding protein [Candidatus Tectomicrobia bacterium]|nr:ABC transporter substrate-binding protein [Candidatus Tectomicrobia bacterium]